MKGDFCRIILGLAALGGISCQTLGLQSPKGFGEPTEIGPPVEHRDAHLNQLEAPITLVNGGLAGVGLAGVWCFQAIDAVFDLDNPSISSVGGSYGSGSCAVGSGASGGGKVGGGH